MRNHRPPSRGRGPGERFAVPLCGQPRQVSEITVAELVPRLAMLTEAKSNNANWRIHPHFTKRISPLITNSNYFAVSPAPVFTVRAHNDDHMLSAA
jgi:hypothetical protein